MTFLIVQTVFVVVAINGVLAFLLVIAERYLANYGECTIRINGQKEIEVTGGTSLLAALSSRKIFLPSACGGRGTCAYCKCKVMEGAGPLLPTEAPLLTEAEIQSRVRLACQVKVKQDLQISIPEELFAIQQFRTEVETIRDLTHDIKLVRLRLIEPDRIRFRAGQYVQMITQPYGHVRESVQRAYSISSPSYEKGFVDLMIRLVPEGICTTWVHEVLREGDEVQFIGPMGDFGMHEGEGEIILVAGGSGMAPMVSLLSDMARTPPERKVTYFFGAVKKRDLFYMDEMTEFEKKIPNFTFVPALSDPDPEDEWSGKTGLITEPLAEYLSTADMENAQGYLCGSPGMINACIQVMKEKGLSGDRIFFDPFG